MDIWSEERWMVKVDAKANRNLSPLDCCDSFEATTTVLSGGHSNIAHGLLGPYDTGRGTSSFDATLITILSVACANLLHLNSSALLNPAIHQ